MKNSKGTTASANRPAFGRKQRPKERRLILLDQEPLRRHASSECSRAMARLEQARAEWKRFEREDKPAFGRWMAVTFGTLLTRIREIENLLQQKEALVHEVEMEMAFGGARSERSAFARVQKRRDYSPPVADPCAGGPPPPHGDEREDPRFSDKDAEEMSEFEQELLFEELLSVLGMDPDRMSDKQYARMFREFKARVLGEAPPEPPPQLQPDPAPPGTEQGRIKEIYRVLVRRLHPDTRAESDPEVSMLWHEVQEAYNGGNLDRLEMLLALTDIQSNTAGEHTSLFQMRSVLAELRGAFNALQRNLRAARKEPAWGFARLADRPALEKRLRRQLQSDLAWHEDQLQRLEALIAGWSTPPKPRGKPVHRTQAHFPF